MAALCRSCLLELGDDIGEGTMVKSANEGRAQNSPGADHLSRGDFADYAHDTAATGIWSADTTGVA